MCTSLFCGLFICFCRSHHEQAPAKKISLRILSPSHQHRILNAKKHVATTNAQYLQLRNVYVRENRLLSHMCILQEQLF
jgi:hypothetical protein